MVGAGNEAKEPAISEKGGPNLEDRALVRNHSETISDQEEIQSGILGGSETDETAISNLGGVVMRRRSLLRKCRFRRYVMYSRIRIMR